MSAEKPKAPQTPYPYAGRGAEKPPDYERVVATLTRAELEEELATGRGTAEYQGSLAAELLRRARDSDQA